jgi:glutamate racemase
VADQAHIPYGSRDAAEILAFSRGISRYLLAQACDAIVVACNTASAAALSPLRAEFPGIVFVGMEPAIKPAAQVSRRKVVGVLATPATLAGVLFQTTLERHAADVQVLQQPCPGLVDWIDTGGLEGPELDAMLRGFLREPLAAGADVLVLACTHYPLVRGAIERLVGPDVLVLDPAPAVARQLGRRLDGAGRPAAGLRQHDFRTTGDVAAFDAVAQRILGHPVRSATLRWDGDTLRDGRLATPTLSTRKV